MCGVMDMQVTGPPSETEIGLRRALGATKGNIRAHFLSEAILLTTVVALASPSRTRSAFSVLQMDDGSSRCPELPCTTRPCHPPGERDRMAQRERSLLRRPPYPLIRNVGAVKPRERLLRTDG